jgi:hypothetical protein
VDEVVFAYSDVTQRRVMELATQALACGADFALLGPDRTMLKAAVPVVAVSAVRTGCEGLGFALMMSVRNGALAAADVAGAWLIEQGWMSFSAIVVMNAATVAVAVLVIPALPATLVDRRDAAEPTAAAAAR